MWLWSRELDRSSLLRWRGSDPTSRLHFQRAWAHFHQRSVVHPCIPTNRVVKGSHFSMLESEKGQELPTLRWWIPTNHETVDGPHGAPGQPVGLFLLAVRAVARTSHLSGDLLVQPLQFTPHSCISAMATGRLQDVDHLFHAAYTAVYGVVGNLRANVCKPPSRQYGRS